MITAFTSLKWTRKYNDVGELELTIPFTSENMGLLAKGNITYKKDTDEAAFILDRNIFTDAFGNERLIIRGKFLNKILDSRIITYNAQANLQGAVNDMINQNIISASNTKRNIPGLILKNGALGNNPSVLVDFKNTELLQGVKSLTQQNSIGFRVNYIIASRQYEIELYEGQERTDVVFSKQFNNVLDQEYYQESSSMKNTCLVDDNGTVTIVGDNNQGFERKEIYTTVGQNSTPQETGQLFLQNYKETESMDTVIDTNSSQFIYLKDWDLGDIVTCKNLRWGVTIRRNILEIEEFYDTTGKYLTVVFGDYIPTIKERM